MKLDARRILGLVALGFLANYVVAWAGAWTWSRTNPWERMEHPSVGWHYKEYATPVGTTILFTPAPPAARGDASHAPPWSASRSGPFNDALAPGSLVWEEAHGWPFRAVMFRQIATRTMAAGRPTYAWEITGGIAPARSSDRSITYGALMALPLLPIPMGFAANVVLYAAAILAPPALFRLRRRTLRRRRGQCIACGYQLQGSDHRCPECGRPGTP